MTEIVLASSYSSGQVNRLPQGAIEGRRLDARDLSKTLAPPVWNRGSLRVQL